ncbi:MAG: hypothetical protein V7638_3854 [Acidobacteriota bacterium]|jgi:hypothetical protein
MKANCRRRRWQMSRLNAAYKREPWRRNHDTVAQLHVCIRQHTRLLCFLLARIKSKALTEKASEP